MSLAILGCFLFAITLTIARGIQWQNEAETRLKALNFAIVFIEKIIANQSVSLKEKNKETDFSISIKKPEISLYQEDIDKKIPILLNKTDMQFKPLHVVVKWQSSFGKKRSITLLTGALIKGEGENK